MVGEAGHPIARSEVCWHVLVRMVVLLLLPLRVRVGDVLVAA